jgi:3-(3-hydroxy-phenyl)propionate hydroxylase
MSDPAEYDVAIVGLGPVGCMAAILFAQAGLKVVAFEKEPEVYSLPRAVNLDAEIIRAFQPVGMADEVDSLLQKVRPGDRAGFVNSKREWLFGADTAAFGANGWQPMNLFDQPELEGYLRDSALAQPNVTSYIGTEVSDFKDHGTHITVTAISVTATMTTTMTTTAQYLLACDGASSATRKALDIGWLDLGYDREWLVVDVIATAGHTLTNEVLQVCDPDRIHTYVATKDPYRRWEFRLNPGEQAEDMVKTEVIQALIDPWTPRGTYSIRRAAVYQFHAATADTWQVGRVLIAGDAAHQTPPFLGQGMNTGMRDVINLAWKLPLVLNGTCDASLLETYQSERDVHAHDMVCWAVAIGQLMEHLADVEAAQRLGQPAPEAADNLAASGYGQGRDQPPIRAGVVLIDQVNNDGETGYLFRQPIVEAPDRAETKLDDLLGNGFALVAQKTAALALSEESAALVKRLNVRLVSTAELHVKRGKLSPAVLAGAAVLVRPDRLVFGHTTESLDVDQLLKAFADAACVHRLI